MADKLGERFRGYLTGVQSFGLFVELEEIYVQGLVHVSTMNDDYYQFDERAHALTGANTGKVYRLGDQVEVQVVKVDLEQRKIDFALTDVIARAGEHREAPRPPRAPRSGGQAERPRPSAFRAAPRKTKGAPPKRRRR